MYIVLLICLIAVLCICSLPSASAGTNQKHLRVAMAQIGIIDGDLAENIDRAEAAIRAAAEQHVDMVCLPEAADYGWLWQDAKKDAFPIPGKYTDFLGRLAKELNIWVSAGCLERDGEHVYNSAVIIDRRGRIVLKHRKINSLPELTKDLYEAGKPEDIKTVDTEFGRMGLTICADNFNTDYPERVKELGAWLLIAPHGFAADEDELPDNAEKYQAHIKAVAKNAGLWVIGADAVLGTITGGIWKGKLHSGCSTIANPEGEAVAVGKFKETDLIVCDIPRVAE